MMEVCSVPYKVERKSQGVSVHRAGMGCHRVDARDAGFGRCAVSLCMCRKPGCGLGCV